VICTKQSFGRYRVIFDIRHNTGKPDHRAGVLVFCTAPAEGEKPLDALGGIQFQVPNGGHWDYRKGKNNAGNDLFTRLVNPKFDEHQWSRCEILVDPSSGTARMAVAQPPGSPAIEVLQFKDSSAGKSGPFALQMHNKGLFDEFANIAIEVDPPTNDLITTRTAK
jgi:3-keto-disaccharide hydrolase